MDVLQADIGSLVARNDADDFVAVVTICKSGSDDQDRIEMSSNVNAVIFNGLREANGSSAPDGSRIDSAVYPGTLETRLGCRTWPNLLSSSPHLNGRLSRDVHPHTEVKNPFRKNKRASSEDMPSNETPVHNSGATVAANIYSSASVSVVSTSVNRSRCDWLRPCASSCSSKLDASSATGTPSLQKSKVHDQVSRANAAVLVGSVEPENVLLAGENIEKSFVSVNDEDVSTNRLPENIFPAVAEGIKEEEDDVEIEEDNDDVADDDRNDDHEDEEDEEMEDELEVEDEEEEERESGEKDDVIVLEPSGVLLENGGEETEEVMSGELPDPVDLPQPFSDELDSLGSVDPAEDDVLLKSAAADITLKCDDGEIEDFVVDGRAVAVSSGCVSSRSSNSSSGDVEIEDLVISEEGDQSPKSSKDKSMMKRKQFVDSKIQCNVKKRCLSNSLEGVTDFEETTCTDLTTPLPAALAQMHALKKRIPTKENPPPELAKWLDTFQCWSNAERMLALDQMIDLCDPTQVRHMMSVIEPQFQRDFISLLPKELALYVLSFLEPKDLLRAAQTCKYWRILAEDNLLWREKCREAGIDEVRDMLQRRRSKSCCVSPSPWKAAYMRQHDIEMNWRFRPIRSPKVLKGHDDHVITCLQFSGSRIVSGSDDNTLKVWSATTGKCLKTLVGHTGGVWSSQMSGSIIVSGSTDRTLKVWNADSGQCIHTLYGHTSTVRCMHLHGNRVVSGSRDSTLRLWDIGTGMCQHVLLGHVAAVRCVQYGPDGRLVVSGAYDYTVKVWNPEREECLHTLQGHTNRVYSLQFDGVHVVSGSLDTSIRVWDVESGACRHTLMGHQSLTSGMELKNNILVSGNADSTVKVWDIMTGQCLQTLSGPNKHNSAVTCLQFNSKFVITSSDDGTVKLWDLKTGEFVRNLVALESGGSGGVVWRIRASPTKLVCAVGSRNGTEETKLLVLDFDVALAAAAAGEVQKIEVK